MEICETVAEIRAAVRAARTAGRTIALTPTMGALHAGHASLIDAAVDDGHFTVVSIFVNPTQFGPNEDLDAYPRPLEADLALADARGAAAVFAPDVAQMYPRGAVDGRSLCATTVSVAGLTDGLCGARRPGHFDGVCTVVAKLFNIVQPDVAYFGRKDAQQAAVLARMAEDLDFPVRLIVCPTVREPDGLAMSSRNAYLSADERAQAAELHAALQLARRRIRDGAADAAGVIAAMRGHLAANAPAGEIDYVEIVDPSSLQPVGTITPPVLIALAVRFGAARLIDNITVD